MEKNQKPFKPITAKVRALYGVGDFGFTLMSNVETFYWNRFLTNIANFAPGLVMVITMTASIVDAALSWIYGAILNSIKPKKWGRYRSWLILLPWVVPIIYAFQFLSLSENPTISAIIITAAAIISHIIWNLPYAANAALVSIIGQNPEGRAQMSSSRATWNNACSVAFSFMGLPLATWLGTILGEKNQFAASALILGIIMIVGYWVHFKISDGYEEIEIPESAKVESKTKAKGSDMVKALFQNPQLIILIIADLPKWIVKFVVAGSAIYYFRDVANSAAMQNTYVFTSNLLAVFGALLAGVLAKKMTSRTMMIGSCFIMAVLMLGAYFSYGNPWVVLILMSIAQGGYGLCYASAPALYADTAIYAKWKTGADNTGWIMGLQTVPLKVAVIVRSFVINWALMRVGYIAAEYDVNTATDAVKQGLAQPFTLIPAVCLIFGGLLLMFGYRLTKEKVMEYQNEIDARQA